MNGALPEAVVRPRRGGGWIWLVPLLTLAGAAWLGVQAWREQGVRIVVQFDDGHGLGPGDELRHRGITVGVVEEVSLSLDRRGVDVGLRLRPEAEGLAVAGSRFWIVRPRFGLSGVGGLETVIGPRYLQVLPGEGPARRHFLGLPHAPAVESTEAGDLEIVLESPGRAGLSAGAPVRYRGVEVGTVLSVGLTSDGSGVESRVHVQRAYVHLIRPRTRFWSTGGLEVGVGLEGFQVRIDSLESLLVGGIALSTPPDAGEVVRNGHRFPLSPKPEKEWLAWEPQVSLGHSALPVGAPMPRPLRARLRYREGRFLLPDADRDFAGWVLPTERGLLGPRGLLRPRGDFEADSVQLELAGKAMELPESGEEDTEDFPLLLLSLEVPGTTAWPASRLRRPQEVEDCLLVADPANEPRPLSASRLRADGDEALWLLDESLSFPPDLHGACVLAKADGRLLGMLVLEEDEDPVIALVPQD